MIMPMPNKNYNWRPNDNSSLTNLRYDLEAEKWVNSIKKAQSKIPNTNFRGDIGFIGSLISLPFLLLFILFLIPIHLIKVFFRYNIHVFPGDPSTGRILSDKEEFRAKINYIKKTQIPGKKGKTWEELTEEEQSLVKAVRANF